VLSQSDGGIDLVKQLMDGEPSVHVSTSGVYDGILAFNPVCLTTEDIVPIAVRLKESLG
jgi:hypothetical protein